MGLDGVELIMEIEETFDIKIEDCEASQIVTVGELADLIGRNFTAMKSVDCPTANAFYRLRRSLLKVFALQRDAVRPSTPILPLFPLWGRTRIWKKLENDLVLRLPRLQNQAGIGISWGCSIAFFSVFIVLCAITNDIYSAFGIALLALIPGVLFGYIVGILFIPLTLSPQHQTAGGLARGLVGYNYAQFVPNPLANTRNDHVWEKLCDLIVKQIGVKRDKIHRETKFADLAF